MKRSHPADIPQTSPRETDSAAPMQPESSPQRTAREWAAVFEAMADGVSIHDADHAITNVNPALRALLGKESDALIGKKCYEVFHGKDGAAASCPLDLAGTTGRKETVDFFEPLLDKWLSVSVAPVFDGADRLSSFVHVVRDITERKRREEENQKLLKKVQLAQKMETMGTVAGGVAHDLNNVLGVLVGYSELLREKLPPGDPLRSYVEKILNSSVKGAAIVQDLLTLARRGVVLTQVMNLNGLVADFLQTPVFEKMQSFHPQVTFRTALEPDLLPIKGSPIHLEKTIMNLVSNASEAISGAGEVAVKTENRYIYKGIRGYHDVRKGEYVVLSVSDSGGGISATDLDKIFEPFYTKKVMGRSGTGLGLAVVWGTVKDHDGYIEVQSEEGRGSTFTLYFPATREQLSAELQKKLPEAFLGSGETILVVDDVPDQRELATSMLTRLGYRVHAVSRGEEALAYLKTAQADLILLDMIMDPGIDGLTTYQQIRAINPQQKAIIVSGHSETERVRHALELGVGAYVRKPYLLEKIGVAIREVLSKTPSRP